MGFVAAAGAAAMANPIGAIGLGLSAIGLFKKKEAPQPATLNLGKLRADSKANGFNPLTVLRLTGGAGFATGATAGSDRGAAFSTLGSAVMQFGRDTVDIQMAQQAEQTRAGLINAQKDLAIAQVQQLTSPPLASAVPNDGLDRSRFFGGPLNYNDQPWVPLFTATGQPIEWRQGLADRFDLGPGATVIVEDFEGVWGEVGGEVQGLGLFGDVTFGDAEVQRVGHTSGPNAVTTSTVPAFEPVRVDIFDNFFGAPTTGSSARRDR